MKKRILSIAGLLLSVLTVYSQQYLNEDFSSGYFPKDWRYSPDTTDAAMDLETVAINTDGITTNVPCVSYQQFGETLSNGVWWITPKLNVDSYEDSIIFWFKNEDIGFGSCDKFSVLVSTSDNEFTSFDKTNPLFVKHYNDIVGDDGNLLKDDIEEVACDEELNRYAISLEDYVGEQIYIAFHVDLGVVMYGNPDDYYDPYYSFCTYYLTNVQGPQIYTPSSCPKTDGLKVFSVSSDEATMSWNSVGDSDNIFTLQYMEASLTDWDQAVTIQYIYDTFYTAELEPATTYKYRVATQCDWGISDYTNAETFSTVSNTVVSLPWIRTFEEEDGFEEFALYSTSEFNQWTIGDAAGYGTEDSKHSLYVSSDGGITNTYSDDNTAAWATVRVSFPEDKEGFNLSYQYRVKGSGQVWGQWDYLTVYMIPDDMDITSDSIPSYATTIQPKTYSHEYWDTWQVQLPDDIAGTTQKLVFLWNNDNSGAYPPAAAIDNISLTYSDCITPSDLQVTLITNDNAVLTWNAQNTSAWYVYYKQHDSNVEFDSVYTESIPFSFGNILNAATYYDIYVKSACSDETMSFASSTITFKTSCADIIILPYIEDFEDPAYEQIPTCWYSVADYEMMQDFSYPRILGNNDGSYISFLGIDGNEKMAVASARLDESLGLLSDMQVSFKMYDYAMGNNPAPIAVGIMTDPSDESTFVPVDTITVEQGVWVDTTVTFESYNGTGRYIAFFAGYPYNAGDEGMISIDDVVIDFISTEIPSEYQYDTINQEICFNDSYVFNGQTLSESGQYNDTITTSDGNIIITTLILTVNPMLTDTVDVTTCADSPFMFGNEELTISGTYTRETENEGACDSILVLNLTVLPTYDTTVNAEINQGETYTEYGFNETEAGTYIRTEKTTDGCDSIIQLNLTVNSSVAEIVQTGEIIIYPNPVKDNATLSLPYATEINCITITDNQGRIVKRYESSQIKDNSIDINTHDMSSGVYYVSVNVADKIITKKLIKE